MKFRLGANDSMPTRENKLFNLAAVHSLSGHTYVDNEGVRLRGTRSALSRENVQRTLSFSFSMTYLRLSDSVAARGVLSTSLCTCSREDGVDTFVVVKPDHSLLTSSNHRILEGSNSASHIR